VTVSNNRFERYHSKSHKLAENQITLLPGFEATSHDAFSAEIKPQSSQYQWQYALADHLGNVRVIFTDKNGDGLIAQSVNDTINEVLSIRNYSPFGLELGGSHKNLDYQNPYRFGGKEHSNFTGYSDFGGRWLDKGLGRWNSVDPLGEHPNQVSRSTYSAFWSNPITYNDPDGRCPSCPQGEQASQFYAKGANVTNQYGSWNWTGNAWQEAPRIGEYKPDMSDRWREGNLLQQSAYSLVDGIYSIFANTHLGGKAFESYDDKIKTRLGGLLTLGSSILSEANAGANVIKATSADGFLGGGITIKTPIDIPVQRFGNMNLSRPDFWGLKIGTSSFVNRTFASIKPEWNALTQYTSGVIPKGTPINFGIIGPQGWKYPGGSIQFILPSKSVVNQSSKIIPR
jgi:RHS repeat-associated protein